MSFSLHKININFTKIPVRIAMLLNLKCDSLSKVFLADRAAVSNTFISDIKTGLLDWGRQQHWVFVCTTFHQPVDRQLDDSSFAWHRFQVTRTSITKKRMPINYLIKHSLPNGDTYVHEVKIYLSCLPTTY